MNPEIKAKWVAALRSGVYKQTRENLKDDDGFCCLGVLCKISKTETGFGIDETLEETGSDETLGPTVRNWAGLHYSFGSEVVINGLLEPLTEHNDNHRTFLEIADAIETQL